MKPPIFRFKVNQQPLGCELHRGCRNKVLCIDGADIWQYILSAEPIEDGPDIRLLNAAAHSLTYFFLDPSTPFGQYIISLTRTQRFQTILYSLRFCNHLTPKHNPTHKRILPLLPKKRHYLKHHFDHIRQPIIFSQSPLSSYFRSKSRRTHHTTVSAKRKPSPKHNIWYPPFSDKIPLSTRPSKSSPQIYGRFTLPQHRAGIG
jgi:hypothetical protein